MGLLILVFLATLRPASSIKVYDTPNDAGGNITIEWELSPDDSLVTRYEIYRLDKKTSLPNVSIGFLGRGNDRFQDGTAQDGKEYYYLVRTWYDSQYVDSEISPPVISKAHWFHRGRISAMVIFVFYLVVLAFFFQRSKKGKTLLIRRIAGLDAVDEAIGRATEMGRPILYSLGLGYIYEVPTIAGLAILKRVSTKVAQYGADLIVPNYEPIVFAAAQEVVKEGYLEAGRPDLYDEKKVFYLTYDQFGYAAGVDGIMLREHPGAIFYQGYFYAESLLLAETGHSIGAIQISGTTAVTQLPFFVAATDYTLIGEELFVAGAYLARDMESIAVVKGEDMAKLFLVFLMLFGIITESVSQLLGITSLQIFKNWFNLF